MNIFKFELIKLEISKENGSYIGKGRAKLALAEVAIRVSSGYKSLLVTASDSDGKTINLEDLKKLGFEANSASIEAEYNRLVAEFKKIEEQQRQLDRGKKFDDHVAHLIANAMKKISFEVAISPNRDGYSKEWSERIQLTCTKNNIKILINNDDGKWSVRADGDWENVKKTTKWNKAITLADEAYLRTSNNIKEKNVIDNAFETERLRLSKELGIKVDRTDNSYSYPDGRHTKYSSYSCYLVTIDFVDPETGLADKNQIKFKSSDKAGISIISFTKRIPQAAFASLINKAAGKMVANEIPVSEPIVKTSPSRKLNPIG